jgi:hypothetical protein
VIRVQIIVIRVQIIVSKAAAMGAADFALAASVAESVRYVSASLATDARACQRSNREW